AWSPVRHSDDNASRGPSPIGTLYEKLPQPCIECQYETDNARRCQSRGKRGSARRMTSRVKLLRITLLVAGRNGANQLAIAARRSTAPDRCCCALVRSPVLIAAQGLAVTSSLLMLAISAHRVSSARSNCQV